MHIHNFRMQKKINSVKFRMGSVKTHPHMSLLPQWIEYIFLDSHVKMNEQQQQTPTKKTQQNVIWYMD